MHPLKPVQLPKKGGKTEKGDEEVRVKEKGTRRERGKEKEKEGRRKGKIRERRKIFFV